jgi:hypothetical protein
MDGPPSYQDHEMQQMRDDIRYEENAMTDRIIESFGGLFRDRDDESGQSDSTGDFNVDFFNYAENHSEDINENTDTDDGAEDLIHLLGTNTELVHGLVDENSKLIAFLAKQRETLARLRKRISRMKRHIEQLTKRLNDVIEEHDDETSQDDTATVLVETDIDASLLIQPNLDSKELEFLNSIKVKRELEVKLASLQGTTEPELWMFFDSGASRSVISTASPIRKHLKGIKPAYGSCSVGNGTPLQYIAQGKLRTP